MYSNSLSSSIANTLPNIMFIRTQKSGSTVIANWIFQHTKSVCTRSRKEIHFFNNLHKEGLEGLQEYSNKFQHWCGNTTTHPRKERFIMDGTPNTIVAPEHVHELYDLAGPQYINQLKILVTVREPAARELSIYNHMLKSFYDAQKRQRLPVRWVSKRLLIENTIRGYPE